MKLSVLLSERSKNKDNANYAAHPGTHLVLPEQFYRLQPDFYSCLIGLNFKKCPLRSLSPRKKNKRKRAGTGIIINNKKPSAFTAASTRRFFFGLGFAMMVSIL